MTVPIRILCLIIGLLVVGPLSVPGWASVRSENRVWDFFPTSSKSAPAEHAQLVELHQEDPGCDYDFASAVHKYLYAHGNPVNGIDPSGKMTADVAYGSAISIGSRAQWESARTPSYLRGVARATAIVEIIAATYVGYLAEEMVLERTGLREYLDKAKEIWRLRNNGRIMPKIVPIPASAIPTVAAHITRAQATGRPARLVRAPVGVNIIHRARVLLNKGRPPADMSWDEYPFASSFQGGNPRTISIEPVPKRENWIQGGIIMGS